MKKKTISKLKKELDKYFSLFIRLISDKLVLLSKSTVKYMRYEYEEMIDYYKEKVKILIKDCE